MIITLTSIDIMMTMMIIIIIIIIILLLIINNNNYIGTKIPDEFIQICIDFGVT